MEQLNKSGDRRGMTDAGFKKTHGLREESLYMTFQHIKERCYKPDNKSYPGYGGKGVTIYKEWLDNFELFYNYCIDNGWYKGCHISRNNDIGNYEPNNIQFKTPDNNRREAGLNQGLIIRCIETKVIYPTVRDAARWVKESQSLYSQLKTITENIRCKGLKGSVSYGYRWEVMPNEPE